MSTSTEPAPDVVCAGCFLSFVAVRPGQRHCRPSCGRKGAGVPSVGELFPLVNDPPAADPERSAGHVRREFDFYETPAWVTDAILEVLPIRPNSRIYEPCSGDGAIARRLPPGCVLSTNDVDPRRLADSHADATHADAWRAEPAPEWVITNPPFKCALEIAQRAVAAASAGVALCVRLTFLEPTHARGAWLAANPPSFVQVLPRSSFTGDGRSDSVTCAWVVWYRGAVDGPRGLGFVQRPASTRRQSAVRR